MRPVTNFHGVVSVELERQWRVRGKNGHFWTSRFMLTDEAGDTFDISIFSDRDVPIEGIARRLDHGGPADEDDEDHSGVTEEDRDQAEHEAARDERKENRDL